jgi:hypothetical protein
MRAWLRGWFAWRFSLRRLVIATVFLGAIIGLNTREIGPMVWHGVYLAPRSYCGWPLPFVWEWSEEGDFCIAYQRKLGRDCTQRELNRAWWAAVESYRFPFTHQTYRLLDFANWSYDNGRSFAFCGAIDALFALSLLFLILFLQIPRLRAPTDTAASSPAGP